MAFSGRTETFIPKPPYGFKTTLENKRRISSRPRATLKLASLRATAAEELSVPAVGTQNALESFGCTTYVEEAETWAGSLPNCRGAAMVSLAGKQDGRPKSSGNQDAMMMKAFQPLPSCPSASVIGIFDGHGKAGHSASAYVKNALLSKLELNAQKAVASCNQSIFAFASNFVSNFKLATAASPTPSALQLNAKHAQICLKETFRQAAEFMGSVSEFSQSGTTAVVCVLLNDSVVAAWAGDSRAVIGTPVRNCYIATDLTKDHKPDDASEMARIVAAGGKVARVGCDRSGRPAGPYRVLLPYGVTPGLSVARAFGDNLLSQVGVISTPDITIFPIAAPGTEHSSSRPHSILILASDGLWQFIDSQKAIDIASTASTPEDAASLLLDAAKRSWVNAFAGQHQDDISIAVVFL